MSIKVPANVAGRVRDQGPAHSKQQPQQSRSLGSAVLLLRKHRLRLMLLALRQKAMPLRLVRAAPSPPTARLRKVTLSGKQQRMQQHKLPLRSCLFLADHSLTCQMTRPQQQQKGLHHMTLQGAATCHRSHRRRSCQLSL